MRIFQKKGMFGLFTPVADVGEVPHIFVFQNELFKSISLDRTLFILKVGFTFAIVSQKLDERLSVDLPIIYPGMGAYFNGYKFNLGADARHHISDKISVLLDGDAVIIPTEDIFLESKLLGEYQLNNQWGILLGAKLTYGNSLLESKPVYFHFLMLPIAGQNKFNFSLNREVIHKASCPPLHNM